jgi:hypothetical protein
MHFLLLPTAAAATCCKKYCYRWSLVRDQIRDMFADKYSNLRLEELVINLGLRTKKYQSVYDISEHWGGCGPQGCC